MLSYFAAYSFGTGAVFGMTRAATRVVLGAFSLKTIVYLSGVLIPEIGFGVFGVPAGTPTRSAKYRDE